MWAAGLYGAKGTVRSLCEYMGAARDALSMGSIEIKLSDIPEGKSVTSHGVVSHCLCAIVLTLKLTKKALYHSAN